MKKILFALLLILTLLFAVSCQSEGQPSDDGNQNQIQQTEQEDAGGKPAQKPGDKPEGEPGEEPEEGPVQEPEEENHKCSFSVIERVDPTCLTNGYEIYFCRGCNTSYTEELYAVGGHVFMKYASDKNATCTSDGTKTAKCENCDATDTVTDEGSRAGHVFSFYVSDGNATCKSDGTKSAICDTCSIETDTKTDVGSKLTCEARTWLYNGGETFSGKCKYCNEPCSKAANDCDHTPEGHGTDGTIGWYECSKCKVGLLFDYLFNFKVSESEHTDGFCLEVSSTLPDFSLSFSDLLFYDIKMDDACESFGDHTVLQDYAHLITELVIGENISKLVDLYSFRYVRRMTVDDGIKVIATNCFADCALLCDVYMEGDCPELEKDALFRHTVHIEGEPIVEYTPTLYYKADAKGYEGYKLQGFTLCQIGAETLTAPHGDVYKYSEDTAKESLELAQIFFNSFEESGNNFHLMPMCSLERYEEIYLLANQLCEGIESEYDKARVIYEWVVENLTYDNEARFYTVDRVFAERIAVCNGYAVLMHDMLAAVGISSLYTQGISLDAVDLGFNIDMILDGSHLSSSVLEDEHHAWLLCYLDGEIVISDPTWSDFDISAEEISQTRLTLGIYGIDVIPDDFDPALYANILYYDNGELYNLRYGRLPSISGSFLIFNYSFSVSYRYYSPNDGYDFDGEAPGIYCAYSNVIAEYGEMGYLERIYVDGSFRECSYMTLVKFVLFNMRMGNDVPEGMTDEFVFDDIGNIYRVLNDREVELAATIFSGSELVIPARVGDRDVVGLGWFALEGCLVEKVVIPDSVTYILTAAFRGCENITEIILPKNLKTLGVSVFSYCTKLERVVIPVSLEFVGLFDNHRSVLPYVMFADLSPETLTVVYEGTREQFDAINFYEPWGEGDDGNFDATQYEHMLPFMEFLG